MADNNTNLIHDTFVNHRPNGMSVQEAEDTWTAWVENHHAELEPRLPEAPRGFAYADDVKVTPGDDYRGEIGLLHDATANSIQMIAYMLKHEDPGKTGTLLTHTKTDLEHAFNHLQSILALLGWTPDITDTTEDETDDLNVAPCDFRDSIC